jgi:carbon storage regulator
MLVLSRRPEQSVRLGDDIIVTVLGIDGDRVKLGIRAPRDLVVLRQELFEELHDANSAAASHLPASTEMVAAILRGGSKTASEIAVAKP